MQGHAGPDWLESPYWTCSHSAQTSALARGVGLVKKEKNALRPNLQSHISSLCTGCSFIVRAVSELGCPGPHGAPLGGRVGFPPAQPAPPVILEVTRAAGHISFPK